MICHDQGRLTTSLLPVHYYPVEISIERNPMNCQLLDFNGSSSPLVCLLNNLRQQKVAKSVRIHNHKADYEEQRNEGWNADQYDPNCFVHVSTRLRASGPWQALERLAQSYEELD